MTTPQDGNGVDSTSYPNQATPPTSSTSPKSPAPNKGSTSALESFLHGLFLLLVIVAFFGFLGWIDIRFVSEVVSRQSIGRFVSMKGASGLFSDVVIETDLGSYVLRGTPAVAKGTRLLMEVRASGAHFICDESRSLCIETSSKTFKANDVQVEPSALTRSAIPDLPHSPIPTLTPAQGKTP